MRLFLDFARAGKLPATWNPVGPSHFVLEESEGVIYQSESLIILDSDMAYNRLKLNFAKKKKK